MQDDFSVVACMLCILKHKFKISLKIFADKLGDKIRWKVFYYYYVLLYYLAGLLWDYKGTGQATTCWRIRYGTGWVKTQYYKYCTAYNMSLLAEPQWWPFCAALSEATNFGWKVDEGFFVSETVEHFISCITLCLALLTAVFWSPWLLFDAAFPVFCVCAREWETECVSMCVWFLCVFWPPADTI